MKKIFKLLCYSLITVFLLGFGGEKVLADEDITLPQHITLVNDLKSGTRKTWYQGQWPSYIKYTQVDGQTYYAFCLDSGLNVTYNQMNLNMELLKNSRGTGGVKYNANYQKNIENILMNAYSLGLKPGQASYTLSFDLPGSDGGHREYTVDESTFYGVVQMAVWSAAHGNSMDGTLGHSWWLDSSAKNDIYSYITSIKAEDYYVNIINEDANSNSNGTMTLVNDQYLVSNNFRIDGNVLSNVTYSATIIAKNGSTPINFEYSKDNGSTWTAVNAPSNSNDNTIINVKIGDTIKVRVPKPGDTSNTIDVNINVKSSNFITNVKAGFYDVTGVTNPQNITFAKFKTGNISKSASAFGNYENEYKLKVKKIDNSCTAQNKDECDRIGGGVLRLVKDNGDQPDEFITNINTSNEFEMTLPGGKYCVMEEIAPDGYVKSNSRLCETIGNTNPNITIYYGNSKQLVKYKKIDENGNPMSGVRIELHHYVEETVAGKNVPYICGITDAQGLITTACDDVPADKIYPVNSQGTFEMNDGHWSIREKFKDGYYLEYFDMNDTFLDFSFVDNVFGTLKSTQDYIKLADGKLGVDNVVTVTIQNNRLLKISKTDTGTGKEIPGAKMVLYDLDNKNYSLMEELNLTEEDVIYQAVDSWTSDGTTHIFIGVVPGHHYRLEENVEPEGYWKLTTTIDFTVDENGNVILSDDVPNQVVLAKDHVIFKEKTGSTDLGRWIVVGNDLKIHPPKTGISILNKIAIGCLLVFVGYEFIKIYRKRANS